jgi:hypothetical protein
VAARGFDERPAIISSALKPVRWEFIVGRDLQACIV